jgi:hypothetical protein
MNDDLCDKIIFFISLFGVIFIFTGLIAGFI